MALNPDQHYCPIFKKAIEDGLCWEVCFAGLLITTEDVPELLETAEKRKMSVAELQDTFCAHCQFCQWDTKK